MNTRTLIRKKMLVNEEGRKELSRCLDDCAVHITGWLIDWLTDWVTFWLVVFSVYLIVCMRVLSYVFGCWYVCGIIIMFVCVVMKIAFNHIGVGENFNQNKKMRKSQNIFFWDHVTKKNLKNEILQTIIYCDI